MIFYPYGPFDVPKNGNLIAKDPKSKKIFWEQIEKEVVGISTACGCYIFTINSKVWYVGMTEFQSFKLECFSPHKINQYNEALNQRKGKPRLILISKLTPNGNFAKPSKRGHVDIQSLEKMLIGLGISNNSLLQNVKGTKYLKEMVVPGVLNTGKGTGNADSVKSLKQALGI